MNEAQIDMKIELETPYELGGEQVDFYRRNGFVKLSEVFSETLLEHFGKVAQAIVSAEDYNQVPMEERWSYQQAFTQITNTWVRHESIRPLVFSRRCARIAAELMEVSGVRLWHDQALFKEAGGGTTHWHCDQFFWPMSSTKCVTAWIPFQATPVENGALQFAARSHTEDYGRHLGISEKGEREIGQSIADAGLDICAEAFSWGDVSFHSGWTFHRAEPNQSGRARGVMTMIYMDEDMRVAKPTNPFQELDRQKWAPGCEVGNLIASEINPVLYTNRESGNV